MLSNTYWLKSVVLMIGSIMLSQCAKVAEMPVVATKAPVTKHIASPYTMPARAYLALAKNQTGEASQSLLILAAGRLIHDGQWREGRAILSQMKQLSPTLANEKNVLEAKTDLILEKPEQAISKLAAVEHVEQLPIYYQVEYHELLASAYQSVGHTYESLSLRMKLDKLLPDESSQTLNRRALWFTLTQLPNAELHTMTAEASANKELEGWLQLTMISQKTFDDPHDLLAQVSQWQEQYPQHPAEHLLPSPLTNRTSDLFPAPKQIALLLPLTGPLSGPGEAVKDGFMAGLHKAHRSLDVKVRLYNTFGSQVDTLYQQAVSEGADFIIGPLSKGEVATVSNMEHPVPTLLLNDTQGVPKKGAYQFGLSLSHEARQVAIKAHKKGYSRALVIAPSGIWGDDIVKAFVNQWQAHEGLVVDTLRYQAKDDMNDKMRHFLKVSDSEMRGKQVKQWVGQYIETTMNRRRDFDMIFLLAYPSKARQLMPLLKYYYAGDIPIFSTSIAYGGSANPMKDKDLDGLIFCDMPWVFSHQIGHKNWPEPLNSYNRLFALGMDSYALSTGLNQLLLFPATGGSDKRDILYLASSDQIARIPVFGKIKQGLAQKD